MIQRPKNSPRTQRFTASKEVQDTEVIKRRVGVCHLEQRWNFACRLPGKEYNQYEKVLCRTSQQTEAAIGLQKGISFLQDNAVPHKAAITHKKLIDLHSEVLKHLAYTPDLAPLDCHLFHNLKDTSREEHF
jgi:hypothetical protein